MSFIPDQLFEKMNSNNELTDSLLIPLNRQSFGQLFTKLGDMQKTSVPNTAHVLSKI